MGNIISIVLSKYSKKYYVYFFLQYLDALDKVDSGKFDKKLLNLYAKYDPDKLLSFLKRANSYVLEEALELCESKRLYPEVVYLYEKMGNNQKALSIILQDLNDIDKAIDFCKEKADEDLWISIINQSLEKPANMTKLLDVIAGIEYLNNHLSILLLNYNGNYFRFY